MNAKADLSPLWPPSVTQVILINQNFVENELWGYLHVLEYSSISYRGEGFLMQLWQSLKDASSVNQQVGAL